MPQIKKKILMMCSAGLAVVLALALALPKVFATTNYLAYTANAIDYSDSAQTATINLTAGEAMTAFALQADFNVTETDDTDGYFTLTNLSYTDAFKPADTSAEIGVSTGRIIWMPASDTDVVAFLADDVIATATYTVAAATPAGTYNLPITGVALELADDESYVPTGGGFSATITVNEAPAKAEQEVSFAGDVDFVDKTWGDDAFTIAATNATASGGAIVYSSTDTDVATVDSDSGEVTITGVGETEIRATAAETADYAETTVSYALTVAKKTVSIEEAYVRNNKVYDGTTVAEVTNVVLSDTDLVYDTDFTADALFGDGNAGSGIRAVVTVILGSEASEHYQLASDEFFTEDIYTILPYAITADNIELSEDEFTYSGGANRPGVVVTAELGTPASAVTLAEGTDYTVAYAENTASAGDYTVSVTPMGNFTTVDPDTATAVAMPYTVNPYALTPANVSLEYTTVRYSGAAKTPEVTVMIGDFEVDLGEYTVGYANNTNPGTATVTVTANADTNISGSAEATFTIIDKEVLSITGISSQSVVYTGSPVVLVGTLTVGANSDGITVDSLTTKWYDGTTELTSVPVTVGSNYKVVYSYDGINYAGSLEVPFSITKAPSPDPVELRDGFRVEVGTALSAIPGTRTTGFAWMVPGTVVTAGDHEYPAAYAYNGDTTNYVTRTLNIPVYGLSRIAISKGVDGTGGTISGLATALEGDEINFTFTPAEGYELDTVLLNTMNVTGQVKDNVLTVTAGTTDMDVVAKFHKVYKVVEGDGESYDVNKGGEAVFKINAERELFDAGGKVYVNGMLLSSKYYRVSTGSTVITLTEELIATLPSGTHTLSVVFSDGGVATASFTVSNPKKDSEIIAPDTGFFTGETNAKIAGFTAVIVTLGGLSIVFRKRFARSKIDFDKK